MNNIFVFPGLGTQYVGMGKDVFNEFTIARHTFEEVCDLSHKNITDLCFNGPSDVLASDKNSSMAIFTHSLAIKRIIEAEMGAPLYSSTYAMTGHSMGQYSSLHCADSLNLEEILQLIFVRYLYKTSTAVVGGMVCVIGLEIPVLEHIVLTSAPYGYAEISNFNAHDQFVVSGEYPALEYIIRKANQANARVAKSLDVKIPAHCKLMKDAELNIRTYLSDVNIKPPKTNWFSNETASLTHEPERIKEELAVQMTRGVKWAQTMDKFPQHQITRAYEIGPGKVLSKLIKRANVGCTTFDTDSLSGLSAAIKDLQKSH